MADSIPDLFLDLLASLELTAPGDPIHEDDVVRILESVMFGISGLSSDDKKRLRQAATRKGGADRGSCTATIVH